MHRGVLLRRLSFFVLPPEPRLAEKLRRYELGKELGHGKFAVVREARDLESGAASRVGKEKERLVAVKIMNKRQCGRQLCRQEVSIMQEIKREVGHPRLTPILDVFEDEENLYIVLELLKGGELFNLVQQKGRVSEEEAAVFIRKLMHALYSLHRAGIIHRDIKLENIAFSEDKSTETATQGGSSSAVAESVKEDGSSKPSGVANSEIKILDFGFAKKGNERDPFTGPAGTLGYAAPEVLRNQQYDPACDIWSAGVVLYILLAGYPPFPLAEKFQGRQLSLNSKVGAELEAIEFGRAEPNWRAQFQEDPWPSISSEAKKLLSKMLQVDPKKRATARQVLDHAFIRRYSAHSQQEFMNFE